MTNNCNNNYDLIIIGGGPIGLATAFHYKKINQHASVLILEKDYIHNQSASSNGQTRQFRYQYAEMYMTRLAYATEPYWKELEDFHGGKLINRSGSLWFGDSGAAGSEGQIEPAIENLKTLNLPYEKLTSEDIFHRFGFKGLHKDEIGLFQPNGGTIDVVATIATLQKLCIKLGVTIKPYTHVNVLNNNSMTIDGILYSSSKIAVTAGASSKDFVGDKLDSEVWNLASIHYKLKDKKLDLPSWFYFSEQIIKDGILIEGGFYYGFEKILLDEQWYLRICPAFASRIDHNLDTSIHVPFQEDIDMTTRWVEAHLDFVHPVPEYISLGQVSLPRHPDKKLYLDFTNNDKHMLVCSAGWNFKFIPLLGYINAMELLEISHDFDLSPFKLDDVLLTAKDTMTRSRILPF